MQGSGNPTEVLGTWMPYNDGTAEIP